MAAGLVSMGNTISTANQSSVLDIFNAYRGYRFPFSFTKSGEAEWSDLPEGLKTREWVIEFIGNRDRAIAFAYGYSNSAKYIYMRRIYTGAWLDSSWKQYSTLPY